MMTESNAKKDDESASPDNDDLMERQPMCYMIFSDKGWMDP